MKMAIETQTRSITIGRNFCKQPYRAKSVFNISGMSFDAISRPVVLALSNGARMANCWHSTDEGGTDIVFQIGTAKYGVRDEMGKLSDEKLLKIGLRITK